MEIRIYSDGNTYLAQLEDGTYAVGTRLTVERNLAQLDSGQVTRLPCNRPEGSSSAWKFLTDEEPMVILQLEEVPEWLS